MKSEKQKKSKDDEQHRSLSSSQAEDDDASKGTELDIPVPAPTLPGYIPLPEGPQPTEIKVSQPPPSLPTMMAPAPPLGMMPPFGLPNVPRKFTRNKILCFHVVVHMQFYFLYCPYTIVFKLYYKQFKGHTTLVW